MHEYLDNILLWTQENDMKINISKTSELFMGPGVGTVVKVRGLSPPAPI